MGLTWRERVKTICFVTYATKQMELGVLNIPFEINTKNVSSICEVVLEVRCLNSDVGWHVAFILAKFQKVKSRDGSVD